MLPESLGWSPPRAPLSWQPLFFWEGGGADFHAGGREDDASCRERVGKQWGRRKEWVWVWGAPRGSVRNGWEDALGWPEKIRFGHAGAWQRTAAEGEQGSPGGRPRVGIACRRNVGVSGTCPGRAGSVRRREGRKDGWKVGREESALEPESEDAGGRISGGSGKVRTAAIWGDPGGVQALLEEWDSQDWSEVGGHRLGTGWGAGRGCGAQKVHPSPKLSGCQKGGEQGTCGRKI